MKYRKGAKQPLFFLDNYVKIELHVLEVEFLRK